MLYNADGVAAGANPHVNYEPSAKGGLREVPCPGRIEHHAEVSGKVMRQEISRTSNFSQAGDRYRSFEPWERDELINNLVGALAQCDHDIQARMVDHFTRADADYGRRVAEGLGLKVGETAGAAGGGGGAVSEDDPQA